MLLERLQKIKANPEKQNSGEEDNTGKFVVIFFFFAQFYKAHN